MNNDPKISVITCLYNCPPKLFEKCIKGLLDQIFKDFEVLIVNDGSDKYLDENKLILDKYCKNDNRFKYYDTEHTGKSQTLNFALKIAKGKYIAINDSDDIPYPERLKYQYEFLENNDEYEVISNAMLSSPDYIIFPCSTESCDVTINDAYYKMLHPAMMFNKDKVLKKVPFLFEQIYDSMEDAMFNSIMFNHGVSKIRYDNKILLTYSKENTEAAHYDNIIGYKKEGAFKLNFRTFYKDYLFKNSNFTCILLINDDWKEEIEKTLLSIRYTSNNVKIILSYYGDYNIIDSYEMYGISTKLSNKTYNEALSNAIMTCDTDYLMVISKPIRFYTQNWDLYAIRNFQSISYTYNIVQPFITGIDKIDRDNYYNNNGKDKTYKLRYGERLVLLDNILTEQCDDLNLYSEYITVTGIPIMNNDLIFIATKNELDKLLKLNCLNSNVLLNVYLSLLEYLTGGNVVIDTDIKCGVINDYYNVNNYDNYKYYENFWKIINIFFNETKFIYEKIIYENININKAKTIFNDINNDNFFKIKNEIMSLLKYDMGWFLKNINLKFPITYWADGVRTIN